MTKILIDESTVKLVLKKIKAARDCHPNAVDTLLFEAEEILEIALAEQPAQQEPVAWRYTDARGYYRYRGFVANFDKEYSMLNPQPLYTTPQTQPAKQEFVLPGGGYVPAIPAQQALDKMAENARELGLDYEPSAGTQVSKVWWDGEKLMAKPIPLEDFHKPAQRKPLTDDEIWREYRFLWPFHPAEERKLASDILMFARAIEAAHGIKENT